MPDISEQTPLEQTQEAGELVARTLELVKHLPAEAAVSILQQATVQSTTWLVMELAGAPLSERDKHLAALRQEVADFVQKRAS